MTSTAVPVLPVADLDRSLLFYGRLGFETIATYDRYVILAFDGAEVHLAEQLEVTGEASTSGMYLRVPDVDALHASWAASGTPILREPFDQPYGMRELATEDPDANLIRVGSPIGRGTDGAGDGPDQAPAEAPGDTDPFDQPETASRTTGDVAGDDSSPPTDGSPGTADTSWLGIVVEGTCAGCGLTAAEGAIDGVGARLIDEVDRWRVLLDGAGDDALRQRSNEATWSPLEYAVHVRDALGVFRDRIARMLAEAGPELGWWDHEAAIADGMANELDVEQVRDDLQRAATDLTAVLAGIAGDRWQRTGTRRGGEVFTVESTARFALHEVVHHRHDAAIGLADA